MSLKTTCQFCNGEKFVKHPTDGQLYVCAGCHGRGWNTDWLLIAAMVGYVLGFILGLGLILKSIQMIFWASR